MKKIREDIFGNIPKIGDIIVFNHPYYKGLDKGIILSFTSVGLPIVKGKHGLKVSAKTGFAIVYK